MKFSLLTMNGMWWSGVDGQWLSLSFKFRNPDNEWVCIPYTNIDHVVMHTTEGY